MREATIITRPINVDSEAVEVFIGSIKQNLSVISPIMIQKLIGEPTRLLSKGEYRAAVISAFTLLEAELRERIQNKKQKEQLRALPFRQLIDSAVKEEVLEPRLRDKFLEWYKTRSELVHNADKSIGRDQATEIVNSVVEYVQRIRSSNRSKVGEKKYSTKRYT